jgi:hypothetical protein
MFSALKEFLIYLKYRKIIKAESAKEIIWTRKNLRYDWLCRIYTVVNLPPEVTMSPDLGKDVRPSFVFDMLKPVNEYLRKAGIEEMISISLEPISGTDDESFLVVYYFIFKKFNWWWLVFYFALLPSTLIYLIFNFLV